MPFRNPFRKESRFHVEPEDEQLLIDSFGYFGGRYGPIVPGTPPVSFDAAHFPRTFAAPGVRPEALIADLRLLLNIPASLEIGFDRLPDISDAQLPHQEFGGRALSTTQRLPDGSYRIELRQVLQRQAGQDLATLHHQLPNYSQPTRLLFFP